MLNRKFLVSALCIGASVILAVGPAEALTVTGAVSAGSAFALGSIPVNTTTHQVLKISFSTPTSAVALEFCAGTQANFNAKTCGIKLGLANEVNIPSLVIVDAAALNGDLLYVLNVSGTVIGHYSVTIE